jgi:hypothetical protein
VPIGTSTFVVAAAITSAPRLAERVGVRGTRSCLTPSLMTRGDATLIIVEQRAGNHGLHHTVPPQNRLSSQHFTVEWLRSSIEVRSTRIMLHS